MEGVDFGERCLDKTPSPRGLFDAWTYAIGAPTGVNNDTNDRSMSIAPHRGGYPFHRTRRQRSSKAQWTSET